MELHPYLEKGVSVNPGLWYVLSALGECPSMRVGHTCTYVPGPEGHGGKVLVLGGANPSETFSDLYVLDLGTFSWDTIDVAGFKARYEHSAFIPQSKPDKLYVFAGADQGGNHNDVQVFDMTAQKWSTIMPLGSPPTPRTYHITACSGDKFYVYSGGQTLADPVGDRQVHCFDAANDAWSTLNIRGDTPKPRHGHAMVVSNSKLYIHGGMSGSTFYDDMHVLDLSTNSWASIKQKRGSPSARAAHAAIAKDDHIYIFGGIGRDGALDDTHVFDTKTKKWSVVTSSGPAPACRLDMGVCIIKLAVPQSPEHTANDVLQASQHTKEVLDTQLSRLGSAGSGRSMGSTASAGSQDLTLGSRSPIHNSPPPPTIEQDSTERAAISNETGESQDGVLTGDGDAPSDNLQNSKIVSLFLVHGGMDTEGEIFDDCLVFPLP